MIGPKDHARADAERALELILDCWDAQESAEDPRASFCAALEQTDAIEKARAALRALRGE